MRITLRGFPLDVTKMLTFRSAMGCSSSGTHSKSTTRLRRESSRDARIARPAGGVSGRPQAGGKRRDACSLRDSKPSPPAVAGARRLSEIRLEPTEIDSVARLRYAG